MVTGEVSPCDIKEKIIAKPARLIAEAATERYKVLGLHDSLMGLFLR